MQAADGKDKGKGGGKDKPKSAGKGKGGGKKTPEPPSAKEGSKLRKRGEEDDDGKYIGMEASFHVCKKRKEGGGDDDSFMCMLITYKQS